MLCSCDQEEIEVVEESYWERCPLENGGYTSFSILRHIGCGGVRGFPDENLKIALDHGTQKTKKKLNEIISKAVWKEGTMDEIKEIEIVKNHPLFKATNRTCLSQAETIRQLQSHIQSLESQLNIEWDDKRIKEIEERLAIYQDVSTHPILKDAHDLLSQLKKCQGEKKELEKELEYLANGWLKKFNDMESGYLTRIEELEEELHQVACDISFWREQQADSCKRVMELKEGIKNYLSLPTVRREERLKKLVEKE